ncbi:MAG: hypothetical protein ABSC55_21940 [Syntrophorhabdales bacterium]
MTPRISLSVPDDLRKKMEKWKKEFNFSKVCQEAIEREIAKKERFLEKRDEEETVDDIVAKADLLTDEGQYSFGKELGFYYAKTAPYPEIKRYEEFIEGYEKGDPKSVERLHYALDITGLTEKMGAFYWEEPLSKTGRRELEDAVPLTWHLDKGFMDGLMEFLNEEATSVEVLKLALRRDKEMLAAKDEAGRLRIMKSYKPKIVRLIKGSPAEKRKKP